jgi:hypothetical protein
VSVYSEFENRKIVDIDCMKKLFACAEEKRIMRPYELRLDSKHNISKEAKQFCKDNNIEIIYRRD